MKFLLNLLSDASSVVDSTNSSVQATWFERNGIWLIFGAVVVLMIVFNVRQRKKQQQEVEKKMSSLKVGDVVKTIGLIYGEIVEIDPEMETFILKTGTEANPSYIKVDKMAIYQVIPPISNNQDAFAQEPMGDEVVEENVAEDDIQLENAAEEVNEESVAVEETSNEETSEENA
ncbi:MAG: preprotein translocase subunit YajC [Clostridia bacterium]|nr:preprotein translocase subunit YajC [Clostridia bacterium]